jgi:outer membrane cobalamin receptor
VQYIDHLNTVASPLAAPAFQHYLLWNQRVSCQLSKTVNWYVQANNLLNQSYENIQYYPMPGFSWHTGLSWEFH